MKIAHQGRNATKNGQTLFARRFGQAVEVGADVGEGQVFQWANVEFVEIDDGRMFCFCCKRETISALP